MRLHEGVVGLEQLVAVGEAGDVPELMHDGLGGEGQDATGSAHEQLRLTLARLTEAAKKKDDPFAGIEELVAMSGNAVRPLLTSHNSGNTRDIP